MIPTPIPGSWIRDGRIWVPGSGLRYVKLLIMTRLSSAPFAPITILDSHLRVSNILYWRYLKMVTRPLLFCWYSPLFFNYVLLCILILIDLWRWYQWACICWHPSGVCLGPRSHLHSITNQWCPEIPPSGKSREKWSKCAFWEGFSYCNWCFFGNVRGTGLGLCKIIFFSIVGSCWISSVTASLNRKENQEINKVTIKEN